jgi:penicillin-binding protein 2
MIGGIGNGKILYKPTLLKEERSYDGILIRKTKPFVSHELHVDSITLALIHNSMEEVITAGGTGTRAAFKGIPIGGKTGSAQNPHGEKTHALFVACAPMDNPVISISAVAENAGHGGSIAAPIAGAIFNYFFSQTPEGKEIAAQYLKKDKNSAPDKE